MNRSMRCLLSLTLFLPVLACGETLPDPAPILAVKYASETETWGRKERQIYYFTPQGTELHGLRYSWFRHLRRPFSNEKLSDPRVMGRFGFLYDDQSTDATNPGGFPIGFAFHADPNSAKAVKDGRSGDAFLDITCAACHTGQLNYKGVGVRIDGGQAFHALGSTEIGQFAASLVAALVHTYVSPTAFDQFASEVLGTEYPQRKAELREELGRTVWKFVLEAWNGKDYYPTKDGFGRIDALGHIANAVFGDALNPQNYTVANAPVNFPHVWDIWRFDWVQWNGSVAQAMGRNVGEALGVKAPVKLVSETGSPLDEKERYESSVLVREIHCIETTLWRLDPPVWPQDLFGKIDRDRAAHGEKLFRKNCRGCHGPWRYLRSNSPSKDKPIEWKMTLIPTVEIGTDPYAADNFVDYRYDASVMDPGNPQLEEIGSGWALDTVTAKVIERKYDDLEIPEEQRAEFDGFGRKTEVQIRRAYKSRPLHGIWATPPFLHNGSVRTVYQLLMPDEEREKFFYIATREYDPTNLGYVNACLDDPVVPNKPCEEPVAGAFEFDTSVDGNSNRGHQFRNDGGAGVIGPALDHEKRMAIIEYLKWYGGKEPFLVKGKGNSPPPPRESAAYYQNHENPTYRNAMRQNCTSPSKNDRIQGPVWALLTDEERLASVDESGSEAESGGSQ